MNQKTLNYKLLFAWGIIMTGGAILLFTGITHESLWYDESYTGAIVNHSLADIINITGGDNHPPLYYMMLRIFRLVFGNSILSLRAFSVIGALALAALGIGPVRRAMGDRTGIIYTLLTLSLPITFAMAQEARMYTWAAFWVTGSALYGYLGYSESKLKDWILFVVFLLGAAYTHYYALLAVFMVCALLLLMMIIKKKKIIPFFYAAGVMAVAYIPWLFKLTGAMTRVKGRYWIPQVTADVIRNVFVYPFSNKFSTPAFPDLLIYIFIIAVALILWGIFTRLAKKDDSVIMAIIAAGTYILTIGAGIAASYIIRPVLVERYIVSVLGVFVMGLSYGIANLGKKVHAAVFVSLLILAVSGLQIQYSMTNRFNGPMTEAANTLKVEPGDIFLHTDEHTLGTFCYYYPNNMNYYYVREGTDGYSNYDAFKPNGILIKSLDEIGKDNRIWLVKRSGGTDTVSASGWMNSNILRVKGAPASFRAPPSFYSFLVYETYFTKTGSEKANSDKATFGSLIVRANGFNNDTGKAIVSLYTNDSMPLTSQITDIRDGATEVEFKAVPFGDYSVLVLHDENNNQNVDMNNKNLPVEGLGYSNSFSEPQGPPEYEKHKFTFDANYTPIDIPMFYFETQ